MAATNFNTSNLTFRQLIGNGLTYVIPRFQRDYSWTADEWDDLWQDIVGTVPPGSEPAHYMGYLVLQSKDNKVFEVIDGQQRLTTLSLLTLAILKVLQDFVDQGIDRDANKLRIDQLRNTYIGYLDPVTLVPRSKLSLNRNNDAYYQDYLVPLRPLPQRNLRSSEHLLRKAFDWLYRQIKEKFAAQREGVIVARFLDEMSDRLFFTVINVTDELNAFKVFETLNSRGVRLSPTDLLKNYLFSVVYRESLHSGELDALERRWESMVGRLGGESFPDFLRAHWNSRRKFVREADLFKTIRSGTPDKASVFRLIEEMEVDLDLYAALPNPEDSLWTRDQRQHIREIRMFNVRQPWPLLLAAHRAFDASGFTDVLKACSVVSFRYNVIGGLATNEQERVYNSVAQRIASGELAVPRDVIRTLGQIYIPDDQFRAAFGEKSLRTSAARNKHVVRYVLFRIEGHLSGTSYDNDSAQYSIEHILPENPDGNWPQFPDTLADESVYRLGNMAVLEADLNRGIGNTAFNEKREIYRRSQFLSTQRIAEENEDWNIERIAARQRWMATQATAIWRMSQL